MNAEKLKEMEENKNVEARHCAKKYELVLAQRAAFDRGEYELSCKLRDECDSLSLNKFKEMEAQ